MKLRRQHPKADERVREDLRSEVHAEVDRLFDAWLRIDQLASLAEARTETTRSGSGHSDPTLSTLTSQEASPAFQWLDAFRQFRVTARLLDSQRARLLPVSATAMAAARGRENAVEVCELCKLPNLKMHRIDGLPFCATSCYYRAWRGRQRANVQTQDSGRSHP